MTVEVHKYLVDVQSLRTSILSMISWISDKYNTRRDYTSLFLLVVRSIACSTNCYRDVDISAGQLACHHKYQGMLPKEGRSASATACRLRLSVGCASCRDGQVMATPTLSLLVSYSLFSFFYFLFCSLLSRSIFFSTMAT